MKMMIMGLLAVFFTLTAQAFTGWNGTTNLKEFDAMECGPGITCSRDKNKLKLDSGNKVQVAIASGAAVTLTSAYCGKTMLGPTGTGAVQVNLPLVSANNGCVMVFISRGTGNFDINPNDLDTILALTNATGDKIRNATAGNSVTLQAIPTLSWSAIGISGTWSDQN